jgi:hypothetical protein
LFPLYAIPQEISIVAILTEKLRRIETVSPP